MLGIWQESTERPKSTAIFKLYYSYRLIHTYTSRTATTYRRDKNIISSLKLKLKSAECMFISREYITRELDFFWYPLPYQSHWGSWLHQTQYYILLLPNACWSEQVHYFLYHNRGITLSNYKYIKVIQVTDIKLHRISTVQQSTSLEVGLCSV